MNVGVAQKSVGCVVSTRTQYNLTDLLKSVSACLRNSCAQFGDIFHFVYVLIKTYYQARRHKCNYGHMYVCKFISGLGVS